MSVFVKFSNFEQRVWALAGLNSKENLFLGFLPDFPEKDKLLVEPGKLILKP